MQQNSHSASTVEAAQVKARLLEQPPKNQEHAEQEHRHADDCANDRQGRNGTNDHEYDPEQDRINPPAEKRIARREGVKALRYLATHLGYQIEAAEPKFPATASPGDRITIRTGWRQKGNAKPYEDFRVFLALRNRKRTVDLGAYRPRVPTSRWFNPSYSARGAKGPIRKWRESDPPFAGEEVFTVSLPAALPSGSYHLVLGLLTAAGYRIKLTNGRDEEGTRTPNDLSDDAFGGDYFESAATIRIARK